MLFDVIYTIVEPIISIINVISMQIVKNVSVFETLVIGDGLVSSLSYTNTGNYNPYKLNIIDRYSLYAVTNIVSLVYPPSIYLLVYLVIPKIQNLLVKGNKYIQMYHENQKIFVYYFISKSTIAFIKNLNSKFIEIKNYQIFVLYKYLSFTLLCDFLKSFLFLQVIYLLRSFESTYYYYKVIKLGYYYTSGYLFNAVSEDNAIYLINMMIKEKRWYDITKIEYVHALYSLIDLKYQVNKKRIVDVYNQYVIKFFSLWSIISLMKLFNIYFNFLLIVFYIIGIGDPIIPGIIYSLLLVDTNDIIITFVVINYKLVYYFLSEMVFFVYNMNDIKKVIDKFDKTEKPIFQTVETGDNFFVITDITKKVK
jgi:hypothetical protein